MCIRSCLDSYKNLESSSTNSAFILLPNFTGVELGGLNKGTVMLEVKSIFRVMLKDDHVEVLSLAEAIGVASEVDGKYKDGYASHILHFHEAYLNGDHIEGLGGQWRRIGVPFAGNDSCKVLDTDDENASEEVLSRLVDYRRLVDLGLTQEKVKEHRIALRRLSLALGGVYPVQGVSSERLSTVVDVESLSSVVSTELGFSDSAMQYFAQDINKMANEHFH